MARAKPKLLSGDNPQVPKGDGDAPVQAYLDAIPGWKQDAARRLDALIAKQVPRVQRAIRWNSPFYSVGDGWFVSFHCFTRYIKVTFFQGAQLQPQPPEGSKDPMVRYYHVTQEEGIDKELFGSWIRQAAALPGWTGS